MGETFAAPAWMPGLQGRHLDQSSETWRALCRVLTLCNRAAFKPGPGRSAGAQGESSGRSGSRGTKPGDPGSLVVQPGSPLTPPAFPAHRDRGRVGDGAASPLRADAGTMGYRERFPKVCEIPFNSTNKFQVRTRRGRPRPRSSPAHHKSRPPEAPPTFRAGLRPAFTLRPLPLHSQRPARARALRPLSAVRPSMRRSSQSKSRPSPTPDLNSARSPLPGSLSRPVGPLPNPQPLLRTSPASKPSAQSLPQRLGSVSPSVPQALLSLP